MGSSDERRSENVKQRNAAGRTPEHERMVRLGYYAHLVAKQWERHPAAPTLMEHGYDVAAVMAEMSAWAYKRAHKFDAENLADFGRRPNDAE